VFLCQDFGDIRTEMKAMMRAAMSANMWKESATWADFMKPFRPKFADKA
jgi:hypothetical protein